MLSWHLILRLGRCGTPLQWLTPHSAAVLMTRDQVLWSLGESAAELRGGRNAQGLQSRLCIPSIIATRGAVKRENFSPGLTNVLLFRRDQQLCLYCGKHFPVQELSRDHVLPSSRGGPDCWENVVTACKRCNHHKGCRTPEEAGMALLAVPYKPNIFEYTVLANRRILSDQMAFLSSGFSSRFCPMQ